MKNNLFYLILSSLIFLYYFILCFIYSEYRIINLDATLYLTSIINDSYTLFDFRLISWITLIPLLILVKFKVSLSTLILVYSISFFILPFVLYLYSILIYKDYKNSIIIPLSMITMSSATFYYPVTEIFPSLYFSVFFWISLKNSNYKLGYIAMILAQVSHPIGVLVCLFVIFNVAISKQKKIIYYVSSLLFVLAQILYSFIKNDSQIFYFKSLTDSTSSDLTLVNPIVQYFINHIYNHSFFYFPVVLLFVIIIGVRLLKRELTYTLVFILYFISTMFIISLTYKVGESALIIEKILLPIGTIILISLFSSSYLMNSNIVIKLIVLSLSVFYLREISLEEKAQSRRFLFVENNLNKIVEKSGYGVMKKTDETNFEFIPWAFSTETLLYSTLKLNKSITIYCYNEESIESEVKLANEAQLFLYYPFDKFKPIDEFNEFYFKFERVNYVKI